MEISHIYCNLPTLETDRLILRKVTLEDAEDIFYYGKREEVTKYVTWGTHKTLADTEEFINFILNKYNNNEVAPWGIECKESGRLIGTIDFVWWEPNKQIAEIGYAISKDCWGKGLTTEAAMEVIKFGFEKMNLTRIQAKCMVENIGSARVMEKIGMSFEGIMRKGLFAKGKHQDIRMYSILKEEYFF